jgi:hypothetical protein
VLISKKRAQVDHPQLLLNGEPIKRVPIHKHLGLNISQDLTWRNHIEDISDKANRRLGILRRLKYKLDRLSLERIYLGFIRPILEYGDIVWDTPGEILDSLEKIQLNAARVITGATAKCSSQSLYNETGWQPLSDRREAHRLTLMYQIMNGKAPQYLGDLVPGLVQDRTGYLLRNRGELDTPLARLNLYANSFFPSTVTKWNNLDHSVKSLPSVDAFKAFHKRSLPVRNPLFFYGGRLESAIHARMRMRNSPLNADLSNRLHVIESPLCSCGAEVEETAKHFFFQCSKYTVLRAELVQNLLPHKIKKVDYLLHGLPDSDHVTNIHIFAAVHKYIRESKRFY